MKVQNSILRTIIFGAVKRGANFQRLCQKIGIDPSELNEAEKLVDWEISALAWDHALEMADDPQLALHMGEDINFSALGMLGFLMQSSSTLEEALTVLVKYNSTLTTIFTFSTEISNKEFKFFFEPLSIYVTKYPESARQSVELMASSWIQGFYFLTGKKIYPIKAEFTFPKREIQEYERILNANIVFNAKRNCLTYNIDDISTPIISYDKSLYSFFNLLLIEKQKTLDIQKSFSDEIKEVLIRNFAGQIPPIEVVASQMNMSLRTFQRRLSKEKLTFRKVSNELRKVLALSLMKKHQSKKAEIAGLLGYADLSSFNRAYKNWTSTPIY